jgi:hypothetical protein
MWNRFYLDFKGDRCPVTEDKHTLEEATLLEVANDQQTDN